MSTIYILLTTLSIKSTYVHDKVTTSKQMETYNLKNAQLYLPISLNSKIYKLKKKLYNCVLRTTKISYKNSKPS